MKGRKVIACRKEGVSWSASPAPHRAGAASFRESGEVPAEILESGEERTKCG